VLCLTRLDLIVELDQANLTLTAEAGVVTQRIYDAADAVGLFYPPDPGSMKISTIGGNVAENSGGLRGLKYGVTRDYVMGLEVVIADGSVCWLGGKCVKDVAGYNLRDLFIGSEGTLGVITAATLKLYPRPAARTTALAALPSLDASLGLLQLAQARLGSSLTGFEVMSQYALRLVRNHFPQLAQPLPPAAWTVLLEQSDSESEGHARILFEALLESALDRDLISDAAVAGSIEQSRAMWRLRESIPMAQVLEGPNIKHDISLPISSIPRFVSGTDAALANAFPGVRLVNFGHLGDGNLHYNVQAPMACDAAAFLRDCEPAVNALVYDAVDALGGSISAEHGIGTLKREELAHRKSPVALTLMRAIKQALDPRNIMNPGRVL
jgi:FAD/FMN-containing dehydrogenase